MFDHERDVALALRMARGDESAFEALYGLYGRVLKSYFYRFCYDEAEAEDLVHETFLRLWRARERYQPIGKFSTYLFQIGKNLWLNRRERKMNNPVKASIEALGGSAGLEVSGGSSSDEAPGASIEREELIGELRQAISTLPEKHRDVLVLGRIEGLRYADIAVILDIPVGTVKSRMASAEAKLREKLSRFIGQEA